MPIRVLFRNPLRRCGGFHVFLTLKAFREGASYSFTSFEDKFVWRKMPMGVILSATKNLPAS
ncbi:MAG: hypothetical protein Q7R41_18340 [Phycisphaerales bacterium]|nr:hypothetical protein [Phycisphaerales bacterium]